MKFMKYLIIAVSAILFSATTLAGPVGTLNTFSPNTTASSSAVNQNFTDIKIAVDDNDGRITTNEIDISTNAGNISGNAADIGTSTTNIGVNAGNISGNAADIGTNTTNIGVNAGNISGNTASINALPSAVFVKSNGSAIGMYLQYSPAGDGKLERIYLISDNGYTFSINPSSGILHQIYSFYPEPLFFLYQSADCSGQAYLGVPIPPNNFEPFGNFHSGMVFDSVISHHYIPANTVATNSTMYSRHTTQNATCSAGTYSGLTSYIAYPNAPLVTGVSASAYSTPITIGQ